MDTKKYRILIINWRSIKDPMSGGAEVATFEHAKNWVKNYDAKIVWLSPPYNKKIKSESSHGINFEYVGLPFSRSSLQLLFAYPYFYFLVFLKYMFDFRKSTDVIIDQVHGFPYLTPLYSTKKIVVYVHEVAGDIWDKMFSFPVNVLGKTIEKVIFLPYRKKQFVCVSKSTKKDLIKIGIPNQKITIVENGISMPFINAPVEKEKVFTVMFLNRVVKMKGIERALEIFALLLKQRPEAIFWIAGEVDLDYKEELTNKAKGLGISRNIKFFGRISEQEKINMLSNAHVLINPSYKEGWGLVNLEANARGTPVVAFSVPGNKDSIRPGVNGYIVEDDNYKEFVDKLLMCENNKDLRNSALKFSKLYNWEDQSNKFFEAITK